MIVKLRKIVNMGGSYSVSLPISFVRRNSLTFSDKILVIDRESDVLVITTPKIKGVSSHEMVDPQ